MGQKRTQKNSPCKKKSKYCIQQRIHKYITANFFHCFSFLLLLFLLFLFYALFCRLAPSFALFMAMLFAIILFIVVMPVASYCRATLILLRLLAFDWECLFAFILNKKQTRTSAQLAEPSERERERALFFLPKHPAKKVSTI